MNNSTVRIRRKSTVDDFFLQPQGSVDQFLTERKAAQEKQAKEDAQLQRLRAVLFKNDAFQER